MKSSEKVVDMVRLTVPTHRNGPGDLGGSQGLTSKGESPMCSQSTQPIPTPTTEESQRLRQRAAEKRAEGDALVARSSEISARFEFGQPIILNHHSERHARRDQDRSDGLMRKASHCYDLAARWEAKAEMLERREAARIAANVAPTITRDDVQPGDVVVTLIGTRRVGHKVVRANAKSITVETGYSWTDRLSYGEIVEVVRP